MAPDVMNLVFTSKKQAGHAFYIYAFKDSDLIIGQDGNTGFINSGRSFISDSDGCYLHIQLDGSGGTVFSADFHGYFPLSTTRQTQTGSSLLLLNLPPGRHRNGLPLTLRASAWDRLPWPCMNYDYDGSHLGCRHLGCR